MLAILALTKADWSRKLVRFVRNKLFERRDVTYTLAPTSRFMPLEAAPEL